MSVDCQHRSATVHDLPSSRVCVCVPVVNICHLGPGHLACESFSHLTESMSPEPIRSTTSRRRFNFCRIVLATDDASERDHTRPPTELKLLIVCGAICCALPQTAALILSTSPSVSSWRRAQWTLRDIELKTDQFEKTFPIKNNFSYC